MALNNEVSILNIANIDNDIKDASTRAMIADEELQEYATHNYDVNQYFIWNDRKLYKTTKVVSIGERFIIGENVRLVGNLSSQVYELYSQSSENVRALISNYEPTANSSRAFDFGEYMVWNNGFLYRVIANISYGTLWREGVNIERVDNVTALVNELEAKDSKIIDYISYVETSSTASRTYAAGDQFVFNNQLVKATAPINKYATISLNGNCVAVDNVTKQISSMQRGTVAMKSFAIPETALDAEGKIDITISGIEVSGYKPEGIIEIILDGPSNRWACITSWYVSDTQIFLRGFSYLSGSSMVPKVTGYVKLIYTKNS